jgi:hypothetical protein
MGNSFIKLLILYCSCRLRKRMWLLEQLTKKILLSRTIISLRKFCRTLYTKRRTKHILFNNSPWYLMSHYSCYMRHGAEHKAGSLKMKTALEYSTRVVQEGGRRCKKSTLNDLVHLTPLRIPLMSPPIHCRRRPEAWRHTGAIPPTLKKCAHCAVLRSTYLCTVHHTQTYTLGNKYIIHI